MGLFDSIKGMLAGHKDTVDGAVDQAVDAGAGMVKEKTTDQLAAGDWPMYDGVDNRQRMVKHGKN